MRCRNEGSLAEPWAGRASVPPPCWRTPATAHGCHSTWMVPPCPDSPDAALLGPEAEPLMGASAWPSLDPMSMGHAPGIWSCKTSHPLT